MSLKASPCTASMVLLPIVNVFPYYILLNDSVGLLKLDFKIFSSPFPCFLFMCLFMEEKRSLFQLQKMQNHRVHSFHQLWNSRSIWDPKIQVTSNHTSYLSFLGRHHIFRPAKSTQKNCLATKQRKFLIGVLGILFIVLSVLVFQFAYLVF